MSKITIECRIPAAELCEDVSIPYEKPMSDTFELLKTLFSSNASFKPDEKTILCDSSTGKLFDLTLSPEELGLAHGSSVMLL